MLPGIPTDTTETEMTGISQSSLRGEQLYGGGREATLFICQQNRREGHKTTTPLSSQDYLLASASSHRKLFSSSGRKLFYICVFQQNNNNNNKRNEDSLCAFSVKEEELPKSSSYCECQNSSTVPAIFSLLLTEMRPPPKNTLCKIQLIQERCRIHRHLQTDK